MTDARAETTAMLVVAAALVDAAGRVLVQRRPAAKQHGGLWEFPGGKVEAAEAPERALARELAEELGIVVDPVEPVPVTFATRAHGGRHLVLLLYVVRRWAGEPAPIEAAALAWHPPAAIADLATSPADRDLARALARWLEQ